ncbi:MAG: DUF1501 domain-containing protein [Planctomycetales bacterium]
MLGPLRRTVVVTPTTLRRHRLTSPTPRTKSAIFIFLFGGPSHIDMWDMKPQAPVEVRGEYKPIPTNVDGIEVCEHPPLLSQQMDKVCLVRSMSHQMPVHGPACSEIYSGRPYPLPPTTDQERPEDWPSIAALVSRFYKGESRLPPSVVVPWYTQFVGQSMRIAGQIGGRMGPQNEPFLLQADLRSARFETQSLQVPDQAANIRLNERRRLLNEMEHRLSRSFVADRSVRTYETHQDSAFEMLADNRIAKALDLTREQPAIVDAYGATTFGRSLLVARRLVEVGVPLVTVNWYDESAYDKVSPHWDLHHDIFPLLKGRILPIFDQAMAAFLADMAQHGLLDSTFIAALGEFGRTPKVGQFSQNAMTAKTGRDHWPHAFTALLAGGGVRGGQAYGRTDKFGGHVSDSPVSPADLSATIFHHLGVDPHLEYWDNFQQQHQHLSDGRILNFT